MSVVAESLKKKKKELTQRVGIDAAKERIIMYYIVGCFCITGDSSVFNTRARAEQFIVVREICSPSAFLKDDLDKDAELCKWDVRNALSGRRSGYTILVSDWTSDVCSSFFKQKTAYEIGQ